MARREGRKMEKKGQEGREGRMRTEGWVYDSMVKHALDFILSMENKLYS